MWISGLRPGPDNFERMETQMQTTRTMTRKLGFNMGAEDLGVGAQTRRGQALENIML